MKIFLSHATKDKKLVLRINKDLKSHGFDTWLDSDNIPIGGSIVTFIQQGLEDTDVFMLFLSPFSVHSKWVQSEWQAQYFKQVKESKIIILPILISDCEIPKFLTDIKYADFRDDNGYESNLSVLLETLNSMKHEKEEIHRWGEGKPNTSSIYDCTLDFLEDMKDEHISLPLRAHKKINILESLKKINRSGKILRLKKYKQAKIPARSIYDHILSVAYVADFLLPHIDHGIEQQEYVELARCIAFHELNEVVLGDIPTYTPMSQRQRKYSRTYAEARLRSVEPSKREKIANDFIWLFLNERHRISIDTVNKILSNKTSKINLTFRTFDKIDPIIAIWRYLHFYRGKLGVDSVFFTKLMRDFFENPDIKKFLRTNKLDNKILNLVINLQDRSKADQYYSNPDKLFQEKSLFQLPESAVKSAIEVVPLFFNNVSNKH
ncbi:hypothetical protein GCM10011506_03260 [Marivirga lumbricoides]|uniref:TIR domain-containing protein n=1 Tax=Marivirga lumbricoides TaxID=1046115 RepID=A0ABQ1LA22_9BACT|nr:hypothetical protein GCM10011506_03260 [Marivirga lumbricoides]